MKAPLQHGSLATLSMMGINGLAQKWKQFLADFHIILMGYVLILKDLYLQLPSLKAGLPVRYEQVDVLHISGEYA